MKKRIISEIKKAVVLFIIGIAYYFWVSSTGVGIPCIFNKVTGYLCPGCGITRMIIAAANFDFSAAFSYNKLLFVTWPFIVIPLSYSEYRYIRYGKRELGKWNYVLIAELVFLIAFGIIRNII